MADEFGKLVDGVNPVIATDTEWFSVPTDHQYQGYVRVVNFGATDATYRIAGVSGAGVAVADKDIEAYATEIRAGDIHDLTMDMDSLETLVVYASTASIAFNYRGLDIDVS